jgi:hypothetical protein
VKKRMKDGRALVAVSARTADVLDGIEDLSAWDDEELLRGQRRSRNGNFVGRPPEVVPQAVHVEMTRRRMSKAYDLLRVSTLDAVELLHSVITDPDAPMPDRIKAAQLVLDRTLPKSENLNVSLGIADPPRFLSAIEGALVTIVSGSDDGIVDAEIIEDDEELIFD